MFKGISISKWIVLIGFAVWVLFHLPGISYGTQDIPLHMSYIGDEQAPVNGALHMIQDKSILGFRNLRTVYYGPLFSVVALPAVIADAGVKFIYGEVRSADNYKNALLWDWGGIIFFTRIIATIVGFIGLYGLYKILTTRSINLRNSVTLPVVGTLLLATNFFYFEYSHFFRHWVFMLAALIWQIYFVIRISEDGKKEDWIGASVMTVIGFGISYVSIFAQVLWLPLLIVWVWKRDTTQSRKFIWYFVITVFLCLLIVWWHPHAFFRIAGLGTGDIGNTNTEVFSSESPGSGYSFGYNTRILINNHLSVILAWVLLLVLSLKNKLYKTTWFWVPIIAWITFFGILGFMSHHESRYTLPLIVLLIVHMVMLLVSVELTSRRVKLCLYSLIVFTFLFHIACDIKWMSIIAQDPEERKAISRALALQDTPKEKILFVQYYILGYVHTKEAYIDYIHRFNKADFNLYKTIISTDLPIGVEPINVYYKQPTEGITPEDFKLYDHIVLKYEPLREQKFEPDFMEVNLTRLWTYNDFKDIYYILK